MPKLYPDQEDALKRMHNGCVLYGGVGSGKTITSIAYYVLHSDPSYKVREILPQTPYIFDLSSRFMDLYIITTAKKRNDAEWEQELANFLLSPDIDSCRYHNKIVVDSWNNIKKYRDVKDAFFIFDEQRVVGYGAWSKSFIKIARNNRWILLTATPGDTWLDYIPLFIANRYYINKTDFMKQHVIYKKMGQIFVPDKENYMNEGKLLKIRREILVEMASRKHTTQEHLTIFVEYNRDNYRIIHKNRWNIFENKPVETPSELCITLRRLINTDESRQMKLLEILDDHPRAIIFYNYDFELEILRNLGYFSGTIVAEWNGHKHERVPVGDRWVYLVQYTAGAEAWNCITTDTMIFYSQNYSYKVMVQAAGRIDRTNSPFDILHYYHFKAPCGIELAIERALREKKKFNERDFVGNLE